MLVLFNVVPDLCLEVLSTGRLFGVAVWAGLCVSVCCAVDEQEMDCLAMTFKSRGRDDGLTGL